MSRYTTPGNKTCCRKKKSTGTNGEEMVALRPSLSDKLPKWILIYKRPFVLFHQAPEERQTPGIEKNYTVLKSFAHKHKSQAPVVSDTKITSGPSASKCQRSNIPQAMEIHRLDTFIDQYGNPLRSFHPLANREFPLPHKEKRERSANLWYRTSQIANHDTKYTFNFKYLSNKDTFGI